MLFVDRNGLVDATRIIVKRFRTIERGDMENYFFHKAKKWYDPFECTYAMGDEFEPGCD